MITPFIKDPGTIDKPIVLDYPLDWSSYLGGDTISTSTFSADDPGIVIESDEFDDTSATVWLSGGTVDKRYAVTNHITTVGGREDEWTIYILIKEQ